MVPPGYRHANPDANGDARDQRNERDVVESASLIARYYVFVTSRGGLRVLTADECLAISQNVQVIICQHKELRSTAQVDLQGIF